MKKLIAMMLISAAACFGGMKLYDYHRREVVRAKISGYIAGANDGYTNGIFTCPCWDREGSFCSLCGIQLSKSNVFQIINDD